MCGRVKIVVVPMLETIEVQTVEDFAVIRIAMEIDAKLLTSEIEPHVTTDQLECAKRLWSDDSYTRNFGYEPSGIIISCVTVY